MPNVLMVNEKEPSVVRSALTIMQLHSYRFSFQEDELYFVWLFYYYYSHLSTKN